MGPRGEVAGVDRKKPAGFTAPNFRFFESDILTSDVTGLALEIDQRDAVISDLAPRTTGIKLTDASRSMELVKKALEITLLVLIKKGHFLCKTFEGEETKLFMEGLPRHFERFHLIRPSAVRKGSREIYMVGLGRI